MTAGRQIELFKAKESFVTMLNGDQVSVKKGELVRAGHPLLRRREHLFEPATEHLRFDVEQATHAPGERR